MTWIEEHRQYINTGINRFFHHRYRDDVTESEKIFQEAILQTVQPEGHTRIHTILSMVVYEEVLGLLAADSVVDILIGIEFIHTGLTLHVDVANLSDQGMRNSHIREQYGKEVALLVGDALMGMGIECLARSGKVNVIQEIIHAIGDFGVIRGHSRDIKAQQDLLTESEYIAILDDKFSRMIGSALMTGALVTGDIQQRFLDELKRFGTFLARLYQVRIDIAEYEKRQQSPDTTSVRKGVVDFLGYEKATALRANIEFELVKMTNNFQSPKFKDLVEFFAYGTI